jgi:hypothetical protein
MIQMCLSSQDIPVDIASRVSNSTGSQQSGSESLCELDHGGVSNSAKSKAATRKDKCMAEESLELIIFSQKAAPSGSCHENAGDDR